MRKAFALILALCLCLGLAACGGNTPASTDAPETPPAPVTTEPVTTEPVTTEPASTEPASAAQVARGRMEEDAYTSEYLNLRIAKPEGWSFYTEEQMAQVNNTTVELFEDTSIADVIAQSGQAMDMMMSNPFGNTVNLILQPNQPALAAYDDEQIFTLSQQLTEAQLEAAGMEVETYEPVTMQVGGQERTVLHMSLTVSGIALEEYQIWYRPEGDYMGVLTVALVDGSDVQPILDGITPLN